MPSAPARARSTGRMRPGGAVSCCGTRDRAHGRSLAAAPPIFPCPAPRHAARYLAVIAPRPWTDHDHGRPHRPADRRPRSWLAGRTPAARLARPVLNRLLGHDRTLALAETLAPRPAHAVMEATARLIARRVSSRACPYPRHRWCADRGQSSHGHRRRAGALAAPDAAAPDAFFFANADVLRVLPQLDAVIAPVEWRDHRKTRERTRETMAYARHALTRGPPRRHLPLRPSCPAPSGCGSMNGPG
jgi:hypothetical protein